MLVLVVFVVVDVVTATVAGGLFPLLEFLPNTGIGGVSAVFALLQLLFCLVCFSLRRAFLSCLKADGGEPYPLQGCNNVFEDKPLGI